MSADSEAVRTVASWACGFFVLLMVGVGLPLLLPFLPDAIGLWRRCGEARPTLIFLGLTVSLIVLAGYEATLTGTPFTPSTALWLTLAILLAAGVGVAAFCFTIKSLRQSPSAASSSPPACH